MSSGSANFFSFLLSLRALSNYSILKVNTVFGATTIIRKSLSHGLFVGFMVSINQSINQLTSVLFNVWSLPTWFATQFTYIMVLNSIHVELMYFNESMRHANDKLANADVLEKFHHKLFEYVDMVAIANVMFNWWVTVV